MKPRKRTRAERANRERAKRKRAVVRLRKSYRDPVRFTRDILGIRPDRWQEKILRSYAHGESVGQHTAPWAKAGPWSATYEARES